MDVETQISSWQIPKFILKPAYQHLKEKQNHRNIFMMQDIRIIFSLKNGQEEQEVIGARVQMKRVKQKNV